jgi:hypothetical protein
MRCGDMLSSSAQEARETGALKEAKDKLEKKVEELTWRVQLEKRLRVSFLSFFYLLCSFSYLLIVGSVFQLL